MSLHERTRRREIRHMLYMLTRRFGTTVDYYTVSHGSFNVETGKTPETLAVTNIRRAVRFEIKHSRRFEYDLAFLAANNNFTYGGLFEVGDIVLLLDARHLPSGFRINEDDYIVSDTRRYNIHKWEELEAHAGYFIHARETQGQLLAQILSRRIDHDVTVEQTIASVVE